MGIDPAAFSKELVESISNNFKILEKKNDSKIINENILKKIIIKSVKENKQLGSSTVAVLYLDKSRNILYSGYLGDSCYLIARPKSIGQFELIFKADEQTHGFNIPFQVGKDGDNPNYAIMHQHKIEMYDLIVLATDGLWDNLEVVDIIREINKISEENNTVILNTDMIAKRLSSVAEGFSLNPNYLSPFARRASENKNRKYMGGKPDDITVVVAQVLNSNEDYKYEFDKNVLDDDNDTRVSDTTDDSNDGENKY